MMKFFKMFARDERGVTLVEYGVAVAVAVGVGVVGLSGLSTSINDAMSGAGTCMPGATPTNPVSGCTTN